MDAKMMTYLNFNRYIVSAFLVPVNDVIVQRTYIQYLFPVCSMSRPCFCRLRGSCSDAVGSSLVASILLYGLPVRA